MEILHVNLFNITGIRNEQQKVPSVQLLEHVAKGKLSAWHIDSQSYSAIKSAPPVEEQDNRKQHPQPQTRNF